MSQVTDRLNRQTSVSSCCDKTNKGGINLNELKRRKAQANISLTTQDDFLSLILEVKLRQSLTTRGNANMKSLLTSDINCHSFNQTTGPGITL